MRGAPLSRTGPTTERRLSAVQYGALPVAPETRNHQVDRLEQTKADRNNEAVKAYTTMGEIMAVFEDHHGAYQETVGMA
ncbi:hypothetical protein BRD14_05425 [Halobacteriales archaeon SW_5_68_122]|nr:MAG: hypothetical protein BRD14_05425 [Halobacteriales archaeon SW_5_68_122]